LTIRNWLRLFWTTLLTGSAASLAAGAVLVALFDDFTLMELSKPGLNWPTIAFIVLSGSTISVISHVGFFSYLIVRDIFLGFLRSMRLWEIVQIIFVAVGFEMLTYVRYSLYASDGESWLSYTVLPAIVLAIAAGTAAWKALLTNRSAFIPSLFFMYVATLLEAVPAMKYNSMSSIIFMLVPLMASNAWQILMLPKYLKSKRNGSSEPLQQTTA
jgi:KinB signaling pathway activation protein